MATSLADLIHIIDDTTRGPFNDPHDAARVLERSGFLLSRLLTDGIGPDRDILRHAVTRRMAEACTTAAITFEPGPGRCSDLVGVVGDVVGRLQDALTDDDRWSVAIALAMPARRCAHVIARSDRYADVPQLLAVSDRASALARVAATNPPAHVTGLDRPIPLVGLPHSLTPAQLATESMAELIGIFQRQGRDPMTVRDLIGVCRVGEAVTTSAATAHIARASGAQSLAKESAAAWRSAATHLSAFADRPHPTGAAPSRVLTCAARIQRAVTQLDDAHDRSHARQIVTQLPRLAANCEQESRRIVHNLVVRRGERPLNERRVPEWLRGEAFLAQPTDLDPAINQLRAAALMTTRLGPQPDGQYLTATVPTRMNELQR